MIFTRNACLAVLAMTVGLGAAEPPQEPSSAIALDTVREELQGLCTATKKTDVAEEATLKTYTSVALKQALRSGPEMWRFLTDPTTLYLDRMAAANQGGELIDASELPQLWKAVAETVSAGVNPSPCEFLFSANLSPQMWANRKRVPLVEREPLSILGRKIDLPERDADYPVTADERNRAPWLWQMKRALEVLNEKVGAYYAAPDRYPLLVEAAWRWRPSNWNESSVRSHALLDQGPRNALWLQMIVKLALEDSDVNVASSVSRHLSVHGNDSYYFEELVHVAQIVILQKTQREPVAAQTAYFIETLFRKRYISFSSQLKPLRTATAILAMGRWGMDRNLTPWNRYYSYVNPICKIVDDPPLQPDHISDPKSPELAKSLITFDEWFTKQQSVLQREAAAERPHLQSLARELSEEID